MCIALWRYGYGVWVPGPYKGVFRLAIAALLLFIISADCVLIIPQSCKFIGGKILEKNQEYSKELSKLARLTTLI